MATERSSDPFHERLWPRIRSRLFHLLFVLRRPMTMGVRGIVFDRAANTVFLVRHTYTSGWQLPGGGVERGETVEDAARREILEECAIRLTGRPRLRSVHFSRHISPRDHVVVFLCEAFEVVGPKRGDREIAEARFFPLDALPALTTAATKRRLAELFAGTDPGEDW